MEQALQQALYAKYPAFFAQHAEPPTVSLMCFGCCVGDGWYGLVDAVAEVLEPRGAQATQVKEKFAGLKIYVDRALDDGDFGLACLWAAEDVSMIYCETCGRPGRVASTKDGWYACRCPEHAAKDGLPGPSHETLAKEAAEQTEQAAALVPGGLDVPVGWQALASKAVLYLQRRAEERRERRNPARAYAPLRFLSVSVTDGKLVLGVVTDDPWLLGAVAFYRAVSAHVDPQTGVLIVPSVKDGA